MGVVRQLAESTRTAQEGMEKTYGQLEESSKRIGEVKEAQRAEKAPLIAEIRAAGREKAPEYKPNELPKFEAPQLDPQEVGDSIGMITVLAAMGGLLTRQPLTAALEAFSGGVQGIVQGHEGNYRKAEETFKLNFQRAKTENDELYRKVQDARERNKTNMQGLMNELSLISAEHQDALGSEMLRRQDLTSYLGKIEKMHELTSKTGATMATIFSNIDRNNEARRHNLATEKNAADRVARMGAGSLARLAKDDFIESTKLRQEFNKQIQPINDFARIVDKVRASVLTDSPLGDVAARQMFTELSKGARGTNMQMTMLKNYGDLGERLAGLYTNFILGRAPDSQKKMMIDLLDTYETGVIEPEMMAIRNRYVDLAARYGRDADKVVPGAAPATPTAVPGAAPGASGFNAGSFLDQFTSKRPKGD